MFFLMSGFVMQVGYAPKGPADGACCCGVGCCLGCGGHFSKKFWGRRFARLGPVGWLALLVYIPIYRYEINPSFSLLPQIVKEIFVVEAAAATATFQNMWIDVVVNSPLWTLTAQFTFYFLFPVITDCLHVKRSSCSTVSLLVFLWIAYVAMWMATAQFDPWNGQNYGIAHMSPLNKIPLFMMGMICASDALFQNGSEHAHPDKGRRCMWGCVSWACCALLAGYTG